MPQWTALSCVCIVLWESLGLCVGSALGCQSLWDALGARISPKEPTVTNTMFILWPKAVTAEENVDDRFIPLIHMQIFIRIFPEWIVSLSQYGSQCYRKTEEGIWKGSCKVKSAAQLTSPILSSTVYWLLACSIGVGLTEPQSQVLCSIPLRQPSHQSFTE